MSTESTPSIAPDPSRTPTPGTARLARLACAALLATAFGATAPLVAAAADDMMARLADGAPWAVRMPNGRTVNITLNPDGTGQMRLGPVRMRAAWTLEGDELCLETARTGLRCMVLEDSTSGGFVARGPEGTMQFAR